MARDVTTLIAALLFAMTANGFSASPLQTSEQEVATILSEEERLLNLARQTRRENDRDIQTEPSGSAPDPGEFGSHEDIPMVPPKPVKELQEKREAAAMANKGPKIVTSSESAPRHNPYGKPQLGNILVDAPIDDHPSFAIEKTASAPSRDTALPEVPLTPPQTLLLTASTSKPSGDDYLALPQPNESEPFDPFAALPETAFAPLGQPKAAPVDAFAEYHPDAHVGLRPLQNAALQTPSIVGASRLRETEDVPQNYFPESESTTLLAVARQPGFFDDAALNYSQSNKMLKATWRRGSSREVPASFLLKYFALSLEEGGRLNCRIGEEDARISKDASGGLWVIRGSQTDRLNAEMLRSTLLQGIATNEVQLSLDGDGRIELLARGNAARRLRQ